MSGLGTNLISAITVACFFTSVVSGAPSDIDRELRPQYQQASEYYLSHVAGEIIVPVNLIGAVAKPGLYYVPKNTDIYRLIAAAGGLRSDADGDEITIKRRIDQQESVIKVLFAENLKNVNVSSTILQSEDIVNIPFKEPLVSQESMTLLSVVVSIFSILISAVILQKTLE